MKKKISLLLAGGGVKAMSYLGFIKALEDTDQIWNLNNTSVNKHLENKN